ncbi:hypothetical protein HK096_001704, partial [Nowakowskiella sp. JEL0078]
MKNFVISLLFISSNLLSIVRINAQKNDSCSPWKDKILIPYSTALDCLDSFPLPSATIINQILDTISTIYSLYPYNDVVASSPDSNFPSTVSISDRITAIKAKVTSYKTERAFHEDIDSLVTDLKDAHASYSHCFKRFTWTQPWSIVADYPNALLEANTANTIKPRLRLNSIITDNTINRDLPKQ